MKREWLFFVMKVKPAPGQVTVLIGDKEIVDSYDDPIKAAEACDKLNEDTSEAWHFLEPRPVIASFGHSSCSRCDELNQEKVAHFEDTGIS